MFSFIKLYKYIVNYFNLRAFCPALPRGFSHSPHLAPPRWKIRRPEHPWLRFLCHWPRSSSSSARSLCSVACCPSYISFSDYETRSLSDVPTMQERVQSQFDAVVSSNGWSGVPAKNADVLGKTSKQNKTFQFGHSPKVGVGGLPLPEF